MKFHWVKTGVGTRYCKTLGVGFNHGWLAVEDGNEREEAGLQTTVIVGLWWRVARLTFRHDGEDGLKLHCRRAAVRGLRAAPRVIGTLGDLGRAKRAAVTLLGWLAFFAAMALLYFLI